MQDGSPLVGVNITFPQHPEYGYTISRQDGRYRYKLQNAHLSVFFPPQLPPVLLCFTLSTFISSFDLVTLGAMSVTLMFQRPPFLPQTRTIWTPNNNFLVLDQVTMSREEAQTPKCDIRSVLSPYPLVLPYPLPRYTGACAEKGPAVPELQVLSTLLCNTVFSQRCFSSERYSKEKYSPDCIFNLRLLYLVSMHFNYI